MTLVASYKPSRFTFRTRNSRNELVLYNSFTGAVGVVSKEDEGLVESALSSKVLQAPLAGTLQDLVEGGILVPSEVDEFEKAANFHNEVFQATDRLWLTIMPTEECNFRCVYCYEDFKVKEMPRAVLDGIKQLVAQRAPNLSVLSIAWFGGEPTEAPEVITELSEFFLQICEQYGIQYYAGMTTNGYNLTPEYVDHLVTACQVSHFNITLDGLEAEHDKRRILKHGGQTFERIMSNLKQMKASTHEFYCQLRTNFDQESVEEIPKLMDYIADTFEGDERFPVYYRNIGKWGGPNDDQLQVCDGSAGLRSMYALHKTAKEKGLPLATIEQNLGPSNSVCYAALPYSLVVGADGTIYKCTVALDKDYNKVGHIDADGHLQLHEERFQLWVGSNETIDSGCQKCFFRPSCQGAACPLERIESNVQPCPPSKTHLKHVLDVITT
ncbi:radical SAM/SPASM domain-containing protein [Tumebacillus permanentifrigoris]|uniref:Radical SAM core domain-containing protein n=1 Tax=Tumebacillus permanentifrigoris TaxID=378543 RepID=A0A316DST7_9BACL|nr:radical SAM protein [Tumebacillus permanentifrigoris]PWK09589.1 uncharacterized protein C7459_11323 [Tumebacillus permanentifrigoris]